MKKTGNLTTLRKAWQKIMRKAKRQIIWRKHLQFISYTERLIFLIYYKLKNRRDQKIAQAMDKTHGHAKILTHSKSNAQKCMSYQFLTHQVGTNLKFNNWLCYWQGYGESHTKWKRIWQNLTKLMMHLPFYPPTTLWDCHFKIYINKYKTTYFHGYSL